jgi:hypothetical protein
VEGVDRWVLQWRRALFAWEYELMLELLEAVPIVVCVEENDRWIWTQEENGCFTVKSAYLLLGRVFVSEMDFGSYELSVLHNMWRSSAAPSKVITFSWKLLRNRIPTRVNLAVRRVQMAGGSMDCILCVGKREDADHLFIRWLGFEFVMPQNPFSFFDCFVGAASSKKLAKVFALVWHTTRYGRFGDLETRCHSQMGLETW